MRTSQVSRSEYVVGKICLGHLNGSRCTVAIDDLITKAVIAERARLAAEELAQWMYCFPDTPIDPAVQLARICRVASARAMMALHLSAPAPEGQK
jgi:hypothetical protein